MPRMNSQHKLKEPHRQYNFLIDEEQYQRLIAKADEMMTTPAALVRKAVANFLGKKDGTPIDSIDSPDSR